MTAEPFPFFCGAVGGAEVPMCGSQGWFPAEPVKLTSGAEEDTYSLVGDASLAGQCDARGASPPFGTSSGSSFCMWPADT